MDRGSCYECKKRKPNCHSTCEEYRAWKEKLNKQKKEDTYVVYEISAYKRMNTQIEKKKLKREKQ